MPASTIIIGNDDTSGGEVFASTDGALSLYDLLSSTSLSTPHEQIHLKEDVYNNELYIGVPKDVATTSAALSTPERQSVRDEATVLLQNFHNELRTCAAIEESRVETLGWGITALREGVDELVEELKVISQTLKDTALSPKGHDILNANQDLVDLQEVVHAEQKATVEADLEKAQEERLERLSQVTRYQEYPVLDTLTKEAHRVVSNAVQIFLEKGEDTPPETYQKIQDSYEVVHELVTDSGFERLADPLNSIILNATTQAEFAALNNDQDFDLMATIKAQVREIVRADFQSCREELTKAKMRVKELNDRLIELHEIGHDAVTNDEIEVKKATLRYLLDESTDSDGADIKALKEKFELHDSIVKTKTDLAKDVIAAHDSKTYLIEAAKTLKKMGPSMDIINSPAPAGDDSAHTLAILTHNVSHLKSLVQEKLPLLKEASGSAEFGLEIHLGLTLEGHLSNKTPLLKTSHRIATQLSRIEGLNHGIQHTLRFVESSYAALSEATSFNAHASEKESTFNPVDLVHNLREQMAICETFANAPREPVEVMVQSKNDLLKMSMINQEISLFVTECDVDKNITQKSLPEHYKVHGALLGQILGIVKEIEAKLGIEQPQSDEITSLKSKDWIGNVLSDYSSKSELDAMTESGGDLMRDLVRHFSKVFGVNSLQLVIPLQELQSVIAETLASEHSFDQKVIIIDEMLVEHLASKMLNALVADKPLVREAVWELTADGEVEAQLLIPGVQTLESEIDQITTSDLDEDQQLEQTKSLLVEYVIAAEAAEQAKAAQNAAAKYTIPDELAMEAEMMISVGMPEMQNAEESTTTTKVKEKAKDEEIQLAREILAGVSNLTPSKLTSTTHVAHSPAKLTPTSATTTAAVGPLHTATLHSAPATAPVMTAAVATHTASTPMHAKLTPALAKTMVTGPLNTGTLHSTPAPAPVTPTASLASGATHTATATLHAKITPVSAKTTVIAPETQIAKLTRADSIHTDVDEKQNLDDSGIESSNASFNHGHNQTSPGKTLQIRANDDGIERSPLKIEVRTTQNNNTASEHVASTPAKKLSDYNDDIMSLILNTPYARDAQLFLPTDIGGKKIDHEFIAKTLGAALNRGKDLSSTIHTNPVFAAEYERLLNTSKASEKLRFASRRFNSLVWAPL